MGLSDKYSPRCHCGRGEYLVGWVLIEAVHHVAVGFVAFVGVVLVAKHRVDDCVFVESVIVVIVVAIVECFHN